MDMDEMFYGFYKVMGREHPKMDEWKRAVEEKNSQMKKAINMPLNDLANPNVPRMKSEPVTVTKIGRNDPCPCGSGKKHKKCCG